MSTFKAMHASTLISKSLLCLIFFNEWQSLQQKEAYYMCVSYI